MTYQPADGVWQVVANAPGIQELRSELGEAEYTASKIALQKFLCEYFSTGSCGHKLGKSISPIGATPNGGKILKVRWAVPGRGKSGSLRLCVVAYCAEKRVFVAAAYARKENPPDAAFTSVADPLP